MIINFSNAENYLFTNEEVKHLFPSHYWNFFEQWKIGKQIPALKQISKSAVLDLINQLNNEDIKKLEEYFGERVIIEKLNYNTVFNLKIPLVDQEVCQKLCEVVDFNYFNIWRDADHLYVCFWR